MKEKAIITAAITGAIYTPTMSDYLPITPEQISDEAVRAYEAGAAVCHIHARDPETGRPSSDLNLMKEIIARIRSRCNIVICITTGGGIGMTVDSALPRWTSLSRNSRHSMPVRSTSRFSMPSRSTASGSLSGRKSISLPPKTSSFPTPSSPCGNIAPNSIRRVPNLSLKSSIPGW